MNVLITGANRGIGRALFDGYVARGDDVTGTTRGTPSDGFVQADVTDAASVRAMAVQLDGGPLDLLVCNAGVYLDKGHELGSGYGADVWADTFAANVTGVFLTIEALLPNLRAAGGKIAIISSQMGSSERASGNAFVYRASKAAALNLGRNLSVELAPDIAVGIYHPGWVQTDMGGEAAAISVAESSSGLIKRFDALGPKTTGCFEMWNGEPMPY
ncbi:SDR family NAD(P)-dependent oxidoreductase [Litoreibacter janthinus]|uniref:NAD(P)-dependent dehydrogenase, short-chain alcohol dehydrogenase family n=1 Tax=Litoreibacter janthinus TaxID=670154 RepID=A0A1I6HU64_9RHOB|nr:SDR family NAD(P)-dependent oxidoreductase [Litoreibacter janthinus]SFR58001.1 NAD(P)-dependent dehydrogenase, short-chain alcohol dehydrogenase family [Litoreibacter janthinus]